MVYADMVGYSRLIGLDDAGTLERLRTLTGGDYLLIAFDSVSTRRPCPTNTTAMVPIGAALVNGFARGRAVGAAITGRRGEQTCRSITLI